MPIKKWFITASDVRPDILCRGAERKHLYSIKIFNNLLAKSRTRILSWGFTMAKPVIPGPRSIYLVITEIIFDFEIFSVDFTIRKLNILKILAVIFFLLRKSILFLRKLFPSCDSLLSGNMEG